MKAALLVESLTGNTWKAAELIADDLRQEGWSITGVDKLRNPNLPTMRGKRAAVFCTFALNPGSSLDKLTGAVEATGADVVGGLALSRSKLEQHSEIFASRLVEATV